jgi:hypothetical protein
MDGGKFKRRTVRRRFAGMIRPVLWLKPGVLPIEPVDGNFSAPEAPPMSGARTARTDDQAIDPNPLFEPETRNQ